MKDKLNGVEKLYASISEAWSKYNKAGITDAEIGRQLRMTRSNVNLYHNKIKSGCEMNTKTLKVICEYFGI